MDKINYSKNVWVDGGGSATKHWRGSSGARPRRKPPAWRSFSPLFLLLALSIGIGTLLGWRQGLLRSEPDRPLLAVVSPVQPVLTAEQSWDQWKEALAVQTSYLQPNEALVYLLKRHGLSQQKSSELVLSIRSDVDIDRLSTERPIQLYFAPDQLGQPNKTLVGLKIAGARKTVASYLYRGSLRNEIRYHEFHRRIFSAVVTVNRSLYQDGVDQGIPGGILLEMFNRYGFDINFQSDIQRGTRYELVYSMVYNESDQLVRSGDILYANITLAQDGRPGRSLPIFAYTDLAGETQFFNAAGRSVNKALLRTPVNGAYLTSTFGYRRDPIYGTWRLHRGTDYGARTGTPIRAGGAGTITVRGWSRVGYGNYIMIRHSKGYETLYGHMSRFQRGFWVGSRVKQGDVIGYVGSTGKSTGPHVHYEIRRYGRPISLRSLRLQPSRNLRGMDLWLFESMILALGSRFGDMLPALEQFELPLRERSLAQQPRSPQANTARDRAWGLGGQ